MSLPIISDLDAARIRNVAGLHRVNSELLVEVQRRDELLLIVRDVAGRLVMADDGDALRQGIAAGLQAHRQGLQRALAVGRPR